MLVTARSEGVLAMNTMCTQTQITNIAQGALPLCDELQRGDPAESGCRCCSPVGPTDNCGELVNPRNNSAVAVLSFLAKLDASHVVSYDKPAVPFISGELFVHVQQLLGRDAVVAHLSVLPTFPHRTV